MVHDKDMVAHDMIAHDMDEVEGNEHSMQPEGEGSKDHPDSPNLEDGEPAHEDSVMVHDKDIVAYDTDKMEGGKHLMQPKGEESKNHPDSPNPEDISEGPSDSNQHDTKHR
jgi:hypothetical protein